MCLQMCCADVVVVAVIVAAAVGIFRSRRRRCCCCLLSLFFLFSFLQSSFVLKVSMYRMAWHDIVSTPTERANFSIQCDAINAFYLLLYTHKQSDTLIFIFAHSFHIPEWANTFFYLSLDNQIRIEWNLYRKFHWSHRHGRRRRRHRRCRILFSSFRYDNQNAIDIINHSHLQFCSFDKHIKWVKNL